MAYLNGNKSIRQAIVLEIFIQNTKIVSAESQHTAGLPEVYPSFLISYMVYFNKIKSNLGGLSCTRGPPQPMDYLSRSLATENHASIHESMLLCLHNDTFSRFDKTPLCKGA